jgi:hypothetical protein
MQRIGLHQHTLKFDGLQQLAQGLDLATGIGGVDGLGDCHRMRQLACLLESKCLCYVMKITTMASEMTFGDGTPEGNGIILQ